MNGAIETTMLGKMLASLVPAAVPLYLADSNLIGQDTGISLVVMGSIIGGAWYLNGRLTRIEDGVEQVKKDILTQSTAAASAAAAAALAVVDERMRHARKDADKLT